MRVHECMTTPVITIEKSESVESAFEKMRQNRVHHLVVVERRQVVGVISDSDTGSEKVKPYTTMKGLLVEDVMSEPAYCVAPDSTIREVANKLRGNRIGCLPVVENDELVGVVTTTDLLDLLGQGVERIVGTAAKQPVSRENPGSKPASFNPRLGKY
ncbi:CBS domain-containing protein [Vampirovibrio chlorellavorus]|uniref:CBS domain-containing protein n=1 Tax=Vampirovibrio chlorellavorus TaxID=758823 RepID=UPI0026EE7BDF|nr:CBS domain-containing protein [Vampirovibrio chlorellavorus]